ncbi:hypothetical protein POF50_035230, partial [Streptomyces sp. SL13]
HVREAVRFADGVAALHGEGVTRFVELGPDGVLSAMVRQCVESAVVIPALRADRDESDALLTALATAYVNGAPVSWSALMAGQAVHRVDLPTYAFQRQRFWLDPAVETASAAVDGEFAAFWEAVDAEDLAGLASGLRLEGDAPLSVVVPALSAWRRRRRAESVVDGWCYRVVWEPLSGPGSGVGRVRVWGRWWGVGWWCRRLLVVMVVWWVRCGVRVLRWWSWFWVLGWIGLVWWSGWVGWVRLLVWCRCWGWVGWMLGVLGFLGLMRVLGRVVLLGWRVWVVGLMVWVGWWCWFRGWWMWGGVFRCGV